MQTYLTTDELASRIRYDARTIREQLKDTVLLEGTHYLRVHPRFHGHLRDGRCRH